ncbi:MAG: outer membrane protein assembly factor BamD [Gammaproteobacteria bacterium]
MYCYKYLLLPVLLLSLSGCAFFSKDEDDSARNWTVERLYAEAKGAMESGYYSRAVEYFEYLETRFPFGVYGQQSLLDLAYVYYKTEDYEGSISACDRFIRLYPQNPYIDYAYYLKGLVNFNRGKGFMERIVPVDISQRETTHAMTAFRDFKQLVEQFPDSRYAEDARERMVFLRNLLARHEVNVAHYYMRRGAYVAAANRARYAVENYRRTPAIPDALVVLARAYKVLEMDELSRDTLRVLEMNYPNHPGIGEVRRVSVND